MWWKVTSLISEEGKCTCGISGKTATAADYKRLELRAVLVADFGDAKTWVEARKSRASPRKRTRREGK